MDPPAPPRIASGSRSGSDEPCPKRGCVEGVIGFRKVMPAFGALRWHAELRIGGWVDGPAREARWGGGHIYNCAGFAILDDGSMILIDAWNHCIRRVKDGVVDTLAGGYSFGERDGRGADALFTSPKYMHVTPDGRILVLDDDEWGDVVPGVLLDSAVRQVSRDGSVTTVARDIPILAKSVTTGVDGITFVAAETSVHELLSDSNMRTIAGNDEMGWRDGVGDSARFMHIVAMVACRSGGVFVVDSGCDRWCVRHVSRVGRVVSLYAPLCEVPGLYDNIGLCAYSCDTLFLLDCANCVCVKLRVVEEGEAMHLQLLGESHVTNPRMMFLHESSNVLYIARAESTLEDADAALGIYSVPLVPPSTSKWQTALRCPDLADVTFVVGAVKFYATRHTLVAQSDYFRSMFTQPMKESRSSEIHIQDTAPEVFEALLVYIYSGHVLPLSHRQYVELAQLADLHTLYDLFGVCCASVLSTLTSRSAVSILMEASRRGLDRIVDGCIDFLVTNAADIAEAGSLDALASAPQLAVRVMKSIALSASR